MFVEAVAENLGHKKCDYQYSGNPYLIFDLPMGTKNSTSPLFYSFIDFKKISMALGFSESAFS